MDRAGGRADGPGMDKAVECLGGLLHVLDLLVRQLLLVLEIQNHIEGVAVVGDLGSTAGAG